MGMYGGVEAITPRILKLSTRWVSAPGTATLSFAEDVRYPGGRRAVWCKCRYGEDTEEKREFMPLSRIELQFSRYTD
jgi:hypothetical protein